MLTSPEAAVADGHFNFKHGPNWLLILHSPAPQRFRHSQAMQTVSRAFWQLVPTPRQIKDAQVVHQHHCCHLLSSL